LYNQKSAVLSNLKRYREAAAAINKAIELSPRAAFYNNRGNVRNELGDKQGAIDDYNQAIKINPNYAGAYNNRGIVRKDLGDKPGAIADYNLAIKFNPNYAQAYYNRAYVYYQLGDKQKAREDLQRAAQLFKAQGNTALYEQIMGLLKEL
jgi:tetratricopeptide (TPR) repeat protein